MSKNRLIVLLTDFGIKDDFVGVMKGVIYGINPYVKIIDLSHNILPQSIHEASFLLERSYNYFPRGTIFLVVVDPGVGTKRKIIIVKTPKYYFIAPDNGILSFIREEEIKDIVEVTKKNYFLKPTSSTFHGRDIFSPVAAYLSCGKKVLTFGRKIKKLKRINLSFPILKNNNCMIGKVIYIDHFGNLITNIKKEDFSRFVGKGRFEIKIKHKKIQKISESFETSKGKSMPIAIFGSSGNLEIALPFSDVSEYLRLKRGEKVYLMKMLRFG